MTSIARWRDDVPAGWEALLASDPGAAPSHQPAVWRAFAEAMPGLTWRFAAVERGGKLLGGAPIVVERRAGLHWLHGLPMLLSAAPLAAAGEHAGVDRAVAAGIASLARECGAVGGEWACWRGGGEGVAEEALALVPGETRWLETGVVDLTAGLDAALKRVERKHRQELQAARSRHYRFAEDAEALGAAYALHATQSRRWQGHRTLPIELSRRLLTSGAQPVGRLFTLRDASGLLSATLAIDGPRETFVWWSGTHADGRRRHAFPLLLWRVAEWAAERGRERLNLGASAGLEQVASFKHAFGAHMSRYPVRWLSPAHAPLVARLAARFQDAWRRGRARGFAT